MLIRFDCAIILSLPVVHSSLKPLPCAVLRCFCSVLCSWGSVHTFVSCMSHGKVCLCRGGCSSDLCVLEDRATASLMMIVTLQVPWVMSHLEEIINQVNDWQVNYNQHSECISVRSTCRHSGAVQARSSVLLCIFLLSVGFI